MVRNTGDSLGLDFWTPALNFGSALLGIYNNIQGYFSGKKQLEEQKREFDSMYGPEGTQTKNEAAQLAIAERNAKTSLGLETGGVVNSNGSITPQTGTYIKGREEIRQEQFDREDSAIRRAVADAAAAGLSPLSITGPAQSTPMSGSYDNMSALAASQGQALDFARQYAALRVSASEGYKNRRNSIYEQRRALSQGSRLAIMQMLQQQTLNAQNIETQRLNNQINQEDHDKQMQYMDEQIEGMKQEREWMKNNGYRNQDIEAALIALAKDYINEHPSTVKQLQDSINDNWNEVKEYFGDLDEPPKVETLPEGAISPGVKNSWKHYKNIVDAALKSKLGWNFDKDMEAVYSASPLLQNKYKSFQEFKNSSKYPKTWKQILQEDFFN